MRKELHQLVDRLGHSIAFFEVAADEEKCLVSRLDTKAVPTLLIFTSGIEVLALVGFYCVDALQNRLWSVITTGDDE
jgi:thioredoxin-like negative regulator of GroEL